MVDTTNPLPSIVEPVIDRNRRWSPIWYRWIKPLLETVKRNDGIIRETVDQIAGKWTLSLNDNDRVIGAISLDGSEAALTTFSVLADKFIIVHPSVNGTTIQGFIVGLVNGVSTVGINGNLVVDGTILARHIDVNTLSAITADIGTVTAGVLQSADGNMVIDLDNKSIVMEV
jgi:hypothetical protein